ncbi:MAG: hypothetical protein U1E58_14055 [Tabrizicola sp.]
MKPPLKPYLVLAVALVLPGMGQVLNRQPVRGLIFVCFAVLLGAFTLKTAAAEVSFVGKMAGGLFVWAMAVLDAYKVARIRHAVYTHTNAPQWLRPSSQIPREEKPKT